MGVAVCDAAFLERYRRFVLSKVPAATEVCDSVDDAADNITALGGGDRDDAAYNRTYASNARCAARNVGTQPADSFR